MHSTMPISSDSERSSLRPSFATSPPSPCPRADSVRPPKAYLSPDSSPPVRKTEFAKIYDLLLRLSEGEGESVAEHVQNKFTVSPADWLELRDEIFVKGDRVSNGTRAWANDKLRYNYNASANILEIKMPTSLTHESVKEEFVDIIKNKLQTLKQSVLASSAIHNAIKDVKMRGQHDMDVGGKSLRCPDVSFRFRKSPPAFIGEIAYSQDGAGEFRQIADQYILGTNGKIKTLVGIDFECRTPQQRKRLGNQPRWATCQIFRASTNNNVVSVDESCVFAFRDANGVVSPASRIPLSLADFAHLDGVDLSTLSMDMTYQELSDIIEIAEKEEAVDEEDKSENNKESSSEDEHSTDSSSPEQTTDDGTFPGRKSKATSDDETSISTRGTRSSTKRKLASEDTSEDGSEAQDEVAEEQVNQQDEQENEEEDQQDEQDEEEEDEIVTSKSKPRPTKKPETSQNKKRKV